MDEGTHVRKLRTESLHLQLPAESGGYAHRTSVRVFTGDARAEQHRGELSTFGLGWASPSISQVARFAGGVVEHRSQAAVQAVAAHVGQLECLVTFLMLREVIAGEIGCRGPERLRVFLEDGRRAPRERGACIDVDLTRVELQLGPVVRKGRVTGIGGCLAWRLRLIGTGKDAGEKYPEVKPRHGKPPLARRTLRPRYMAASRPTLAGDGSQP